MSKIILKKLKSLNTIYHPETKLVFKSAQEKVVIGVYNETSDSLDPLNEESVKLCEKWKFKYEAPKEEEGEEDEEGDEEDGEEGDEGDEGDEGEGEEDEGECTGDNTDKHVVSENVKSIPELPAVIPVVQQTTDEVTTHSNESIKNLATLSLKNFKEFTIQISNIEHNYLAEIESLKLKLTDKIDELDNMTLQFTNMKADHDKLKQKFDNIKNLFS